MHLQDKTLVLDQTVDESQLDELKNQLDEAENVEITSPDIVGAAIQLLLCSQKPITISDDCPVLQKIFENPVIDAA